MKIKRPCFIKRTSSMAVMVVFAAGLGVASFAMADGMEGSLARGGKLYDKWYKVIGEKAPGTKHPLYPAEGKYASKPGSTWRCKECHGWDYKGKDGAYAKGKHFTGIKGIRGLAGADTAKIVAVLKDKKHGYGDKMSVQDLQDVANFVSKGQVKMEKYVDSSKMPKKGNKSKGVNYFNTLCIQCHGKDGTEPEDMKKTLAKQMGNPWEVMHKILNGQPDEQMPALRALDRQIVVDIMAHLTTLPTKK